MGEIHYRCEVCGGEFVSDSDEEAKDELERNFPGFSVEDCEVVCDDCYPLLTSD